MAVDVDQIEDIEDEPSGCALIDRLLQALKTRPPRWIQRHNLSIEYGTLQRQRFYCLAHSRKLRRPVLAVPRPETNLAPFQMTQQPVPVKLQLVIPLLAGRGLINKCGELGRNEFRHRDLPRARQVFDLS